MPLFSRLLDIGHRGPGVMELNAIGSSIFELVNQEIGKYYVLSSGTSHCPNPLGTSDPDRLCRLNLLYSLTDQQIR